MAAIVKAWSYSRWSNYRKCPFMFKCKSIDKLPEPESPALLKGNILDKMAESYLRGNIVGMPKELKPFAAELRELKRMMATPKHDLSVLRNWSPTHTKDWHNVWCRYEADITLVVDSEGSLIDNKTGKKYDDHEEQGKLGAVCLMCHEPEVEVVDVEFWYYNIPPGDNHDNVSRWQYDRGQLPKLKKYYEKEVAPMFRDTKFKPNPGDTCMWCNFKKSKGGPCKYG